MDLLTRLVVAAAFACGGCLVDAPEEREPALLGDYDDGDAEHRPGQPCLLCHGAGHIPRPPGETEYEVAGTVYPMIDSTEDMGIEDVEVILEDARGDRLIARTNRTGNFMVEVDTDVSEPRQSRRGILRVPRALKFPLSVSIRQGEMEQVMRTKIWRNGSCAHCHGARPGVDSVGRVYLLEDNP